MADVTKTNNELLWNQAVLLVGTVDLPATDELGMTRDPVEIEASKKIEEDEVQDFAGPIDRRIVGQGIKVSGSLAQVNTTTLGKLIGYPADVALVAIGGGIPTLEEFSARFIGTTKAKFPVHLYLPACNSTAPFSLSGDKNKASNMKFEFSWLDGNNRAAKVLLGLAPATLVIGTGTVARINGEPTKAIAHLKLSGESAAADILDDITGGGSVALVNGEIVRLQITSTGMPITINHASGVIELKDAADWVMTKLADWIDLYYDLTNTTWKELARYDAV